MALSKEDKQEIAEMIAAAVGSAPVKRENEKSRHTGPDFEAWEENPIKSESTGLKIAPEDYYEIQEDGTKKTHFTHEEAMEIEKKTNGKWRVPSMVEWMKIACELGEKDDNLDSKKLREALGLGLNGIDYNDGDGVCDRGECGYYWSRTAYPDSSYAAYGLGLSSSNVKPQCYNYTNYGRSVRLIQQ